MPTLLYLPTTPPQRGPFELTCRRDGDGWTICAPGVWTARGEVFEAEPPLVDVWLREALKAFGGQPRDHEHHVPSDAQYEAFVASLEPVLSVGGVVDLERLIAAFPIDPLLLIKRGNIDAALALREDAETLLAASCALSGEPAIAMARRAHERAPTSVEAATHLLMLLKFADRVDEAPEIEAAVAALRPRDATAWRFRSDLLVSAGRVEEAVDALASSLALKDDASVRAMRGTLLARLGRDDEALSELDAALPRCTSREGAQARAEILMRRATPSP